MNRPANNNSPTAAVYTASSGASAFHIDHQRARGAPKFCVAACVSHTQLDIGIENTTLAVLFETGNRS
jgi:hypothetical protein